MRSMLSASRGLITLRRQVAASTAYARLPGAAVPSAAMGMPWTELTASMSTSPKKKQRLAAVRDAGGIPSADLGFKPFTLALVGRPNVGKSSLFNRLVQTRMAIVNAQPGTTRDWKEATGRLGGMEFVVMDTGGLEDKRGRDSVESKMLEHTERAIRYADVVFFLIDSRAGVTDEDMRFARWLRSRRPQGNMHVIANKTEGWIGNAAADDHWDEVAIDCLKLGMGEAVPVSAEHGEGMLNLYRTLQPYALGEHKKDAATDKGAAKASATASTGASTATGQTSAAAEGKTDNRFVDIEIVDEIEEGGSSLPLCEANGAAGTSEGGTIGRRRRPRTAASRGTSRATTSASVAPAADVTAEDDKDEDDGDSAVEPNDDTESGSSPVTSLPERAKSRARVLSRLSRSGPESTVSLAIVGRPNVGKSTLVNQLLGEERILAGPTPGLTRDAVAVEIEHGDRTIKLVDTAGMRRAGAWDLSTPIEGLAVGSAKKALALANVVVLVVDASGGTAAGLTNERPILWKKNNNRGKEGDAPAEDEEAEYERKLAEERRAVSKVQNSNPHRMRAFAARTEGSWSTLNTQDLSIAEQVLQEGRGLVVVLNKCDAAATGTTEARAHIVAAVRAQLEEMTEMRGVEVVPISALKGSGIGGILPAVLRTYDRWNTRISTGRLNQWLSLTTRMHPPPSVTRTLRMVGGAGNRKAVTVRLAIRAKYITQVNARPPTFAIFTNRKDVPEQYLRFLKNSLRSEFDLHGVPIRIMVRAQENPYKSRRGQTGSGYEDVHGKGRKLRRLERRQLDKREEGEKERRGEDIDIDAAAGISIVGGGRGRDNRAARGVKHAAASGSGSSRAGTAGRTASSSPSARGKATNSKGSAEQRPRSKAGREERDDMGDVDSPFQVGVMRKGRVVQGRD